MRFTRNGKLIAPRCSVVGCKLSAVWIEDGPDAVFYCDSHFTEVNVGGTRLTEYAGKEIPNSGYLFAKIADEACEPLMLATNFFLAGNAFSALEVVCRGNNWQRIAIAMAGVFHLAEFSSGQIDMRVFKAKGYDRLRGFVSACMVELLSRDSRLPDGYGRLVNRLFTSQGLPTP